MKLAIIAGEPSGDLLGGDLVSNLKSKMTSPIELVGVGGPALEAQGLNSLFDYGELSIMGVTAVLKQLPRLLRRISQTSDALIAARPDVLVIIDSPDFTHRVAKRVKKALPGLKVVNYVCPSVWAWKEYRARVMLGYIDMVLAVLPFEPAVMRKLGGPETHYVGHRLASLPAVEESLQSNRTRWMDAQPACRNVLLLPGSRTTEITRLLPDFLATAKFLSERGDYRFILPVVARQRGRIEKMVADEKLSIEILTGEDSKWAAFATADAAIAASGTVLLELALSGVPVVSAYKTDWLIKLMMGRITTWSAALPNLIADYQVVPEFFNDIVRPGLLGRHVERLSIDSNERRSALAGFDIVRNRMQTERPAGEVAALHVMKLVNPEN